MDNLIIIAILVLIVGAATVYLVRAKKRGVKCVGCPSAKECASKSSNCSGCNGCSCSK